MTWDELSVLSRCAYCGEPCTCMDHVIPRSYLSPAKRTGKEPGFKVPSCTQCNSILGDRIFHRLVARKAHVHERLRKKLKRWSAVPVWDQDELAVMGRNMRSSIDVQQAKKAIADRRLGYSSAPPDVRWLDMELRWRAAMEEQRKNALILGKTQKDARI